MIFTKYFTDDEMNLNEGKFFTADDITIYNQDIDVYTTEGILLFKFRKNILSKTDTSILFKNLKSAARLNSGRPVASGIPEDGQKYEYIISKSSGKKLHVLRNKVHSGIIGYYDSSSHFGRNHNRNNTPCRTTAYTGKYMDRFEECLPIFSIVNTWYKQLAPEYYSLQEKAISAIDYDYIIKDTVFTTITINKNFSTALHKDKGDFEHGMGMLCIASSGKYDGGYTMFPQYGIGVDCRDGDMLCMNVPEWHCNSPIIDIDNGIRIAHVFYLREKMLKSCPNQF